MLIVITVLGVLLKYVSEGVAIGFFIVFIITSGCGIGIFDMPKRKHTKHNSSFIQDLTRVLKYLQKKHILSEGECNRIMTDYKNSLK